MSIMKVIKNYKIITHFWDGSRKFLHNTDYPLPDYKVSHHRRKQSSESGTLINTNLTNHFWSHYWNFPWGQYLTQITTCWVNTRQQDSVKRNLLAISEFQQDTVNQHSKLWQPTHNVSGSRIASFLLLLTLLCV